jgi:hypothetical protein
MVEFSTEKDGDLWTRLEFRTGCLSFEEIDALSRLLVTSLGHLGTGDKEVNRTTISISDLQRGPQVTHCWAMTIWVLTKGLFHG